MDIEMPRKVRYLILLVNIFLIAACIIFDTSLLFGFCLAILITVTILMQNGFSLNSLLDIAIQGIKECSKVILIILLIGGLISVWMSSGTLSTMIYYGLNFIGGTNFIFVSFLITTITSVIMGTPLGTISTIGIALLAIGQGASIPVPILLGAIISGAFVGDKISPVSGLMNLTIKTCGTDYRQCSKDILKTLIPIVVLCSIIYYLIGINYKSDITSSVVNVFQSNILSSYYISPAFMLLPVIIIVLSILGIDIILNMSIGIILGTVVSLFWQGIGIEEVIKVIFYGYKATTGSVELNAILVGGGILSMLELVLIITGAVVLSSLLESTNTINPIIDDVLKSVGTQGGLIKNTTILSFILTLITTDQTVGIIVLGKSMQKKYEELSINNSILARTIIDTGVSIPPLIPWNITSIIITAITGVTVWDYGLYAMLCYMSPVITVAVGYLAIKQFSRVS